MEHKERVPKLKVRDVIALKQKGFLKANPEYQRGPVWKETQQKKLVDSILRGYPLPLFYFHEKKNNVSGYEAQILEIIDGQQRINALEAFVNGGLKLLDPIKDDNITRFPHSIKHSPCPWASKCFDDLDNEIKNQFLDTEIIVEIITTENEDEARDLFIRLQAGLPLNPQEKRDAWPGKFTEQVLKLGGKKTNDFNVQGHDFFKDIAESKTTDRGNIRTLCAQILMLIFEDVTKEKWIDISSNKIDDYYYQNINLNDEIKITQFRKLLDKTFDLLKDGKRKKLKSHECIHIILLINSLMKDYTKSWESRFSVAFDKFREHAAIEKRNKKKGIIGDYWNQYGMWTQSSSDKAESINKRHKYFVSKMYEFLKPEIKDVNRNYGQIEREIIYYRDKKLCAVCEKEILWDNLDIHHVDEHRSAGMTELENGVAVHRNCHPKGAKAVSELSLKLKKK